MKFKVTHHDPRVLRWWIGQRGKIDINPPYQRRGRIWSSADKAFLIDSILNDYDVPKFYFADFSYGPSKLNKSGSQYAVIDGKQRLEAIFDFFDGKLTLAEDFVLLDDPTLNLGGFGYRDLVIMHPQVAEKFDNFHLSVVSVIASSENRINELFIRLNRSKPLTGAEIRNAMTGPAPEMIRQLSKHEFFTEYTRFASSRGADKNAAAKILLFEYNEGPAETKKASLDRFVKDVVDMPRSKLELAARRAIDNLDEMTEIFLPKDSLLTSAGVVPVYYWFIRNRSPNVRPLIRPFLQNFDSTRSEQRLQMRKTSTSKSLNRDYVDYDNYNRSTNDLMSHQGRIDILVTRFAKYVSARMGSPSVSRRHPK